MLKIFLSSTYRDLFKYREKILEEMENILRGVGMEKFVPDGSNSQEKCISELKESQIVIFLISPYYGSLMENCSIMDACKADCPMKTGEGKISYTHCEYKTTKAEGIQHQTYLIREGWDEIWKFKDMPDNEIKLEEIKEIPFFKKMNDDLITHYIKVRKEACKFYSEISRDEYRSEIDNIRDSDNVQKIKNHLATNILKWYKEGKIKFIEFVDRRDELEKLNNSLEKKVMDRVEVYGVGGVGKTSLIQIALIIQRLRGKKIVTVGTKQTYAMGSGYKYATEKLEDTHYEASISEKITFTDILKALSTILPDIEKLQNDIDRISSLIESENILLFIDDVHLAEEDVKDLIKATNSIVLSSRQKTGLAKIVIALVGIEKEDRKDLIDLLKPEGMIISEEIMGNIDKIAEGHPIFTNLLVKNYDEIDFDNLSKYKPEELEKAKPIEIEEFLKRVVEEILHQKKNALMLLKEFSIINIDLKNNIHIDCARASYSIPHFDESFNYLLNCNLLKKKIGENKIYEFTFKHIKLALKIDTDERNHENALQYYKSKKDIIGKSIDDTIEILFHKFKSNPIEDIIYKYIKLAKKVSPIQPSFKRLINVGEQIKDSFQADDVFRDEHKALLIITLGNLYNKIERYQRAEKIYKEALPFIEDIENLIIKKINNLLSVNDTLFLDLFDEFIGSYMVFVSTRKVIESSPWKELSKRLVKIIEDPANNEIRDKIHLIFLFFANNLLKRGGKSKKLYFYEANELAQILVAEKPKVDDLSDVCALYDQLRWMAYIINEDDKELSLKAAELYEEYVCVFDQVKKKKSIKQVKRMRPYEKILESVAWHYHLGKEYIKSAEKYVEIYELRKDKLSLDLQKFTLWMAALNFLSGNEKLQSTQQYIKLAKLLEETQQISKLAVELYEEALSQLDMSSEIYSEIKERYQKAKEKLDAQIKCCEENDTNALLVSNIYDRVAADIIASYLYLNNINCEVNTNIKTKNMLLENNDEYDYIILHGGPLAPDTGYLIVEIFGEEKHFAKLFQTTYSYKNIWNVNINKTKTKWILIAGNGAETTIEAVNMFKKGDYLKNESHIS